MKAKFLLFAALALLLIVFIGAVRYYSAAEEEMANARLAANSEALVRMHSPSLGPIEAPVVIVEFIDPACETCSAFYPFVKQLMAAHQDRIRLVLRYAPFHNGSERVVAILEAARKQDKFWPVLETLLATQAEWTPHHTPQVERVWPLLEGLDLDLSRMAIDVMAPEISQVIAQDLADARALNVTKTPEFFVNGQPLPSFGADQLKRLVDEAVINSRLR